MRISRSSGTGCGQPEPGWAASPQAWQQAPRAPPFSPICELEGWEPRGDPRQGSREKTARSPRSWAGGGGADHRAGAGSCSGNTQRMRLARGQWARTTKRPLFSEVSREWMDRTAEVGAAPLGGLPGEGQPCLHCPHTPLAPVVPRFWPLQGWVLLSGRRLQGREPLGPGSRILSNHHLGLRGAPCSIPNPPF